MSASEKLKALGAPDATSVPAFKLGAELRLLDALPQIVAVVEQAERVHDEPDDFAAGVGWRPLGTALTALEEALA